MSDTSGEEEDLTDVFVTHIVTSDEMLATGINLFYMEDRISRATTQTNVERFFHKFGLAPVTACLVYEDIQRIQARKDLTDLDLTFFLISLYYLCTYPKYHELESNFDYSQGYIASIIWAWIKTIADLRHKKIVFPNVGDDEDWLLTVDCTHNWVSRKAHDVFSFDPDRFSFKFNHDGKSTELGISLTHGLVWINGPYDAGDNDLNIFRKPGGLKEKLEHLGKKAIGDRGYRGETDVVSTYNPLDSKAVRIFKSRALWRHETFNGLLKTFDILDGRFRHSDLQFESTMVAVCVLCQYKVEKERPLFDVLIQSVVDAI